MTAPLDRAARKAIAMRQLGGNSTACQKYYPKCCSYHEGFDDALAEFVDDTVENMPAVAGPAPRREPMDPSSESNWRRAGEAVQFRRGELHLSQRDAAEQALLVVSTWQSVEKGRGGQRPSTLAAMARVLGWEPDQIQRIAAGEDPPWETAGDRLSALEALVRQLEERVVRLEGGPAT